MTQQLTAAEAARGPVTDKWEFQSEIFGWTSTGVDLAVFIASCTEPKEVLPVRLVPISTPSPSKE